MNREITTQALLTNGEKTTQIIRDAMTETIDSIFK